MHNLIIFCAKVCFPISIQHNFFKLYNILMSYIIQLLYKEFHFFQSQWSYSFWILEQCPYQYALYLNVYIVEFHKQNDSPPPYDNEAGWGTRLCWITQIWPKLTALHKLHYQFSAIIFSISLIWIFLLLVNSPPSSIGS